MNRTTTTVATPPHLWIVGIVSLLWNAFGAYDYIMTNTRNAAHLAQFPPEMMQIIDAFPVWVTAAWACGVWGAVAGSILLLMRSRFAVHAFALSLLGLAVSQFYQTTADIPAAMKSGAMMVMTLLIWAVAILLLWYAWRQRRAGVLR
jgi:hypothetical protein